MSGDLLALGAVAAFAVAGMIRRRGSRTYELLFKVGHGDIPPEQDGGFVYRTRDGQLRIVWIEGMEYLEPTERIKRMGRYLAEHQVDIGFAEPAPEEYLPLEVYDFPLPDDLTFLFDNDEGLSAEQYVQQWLDSWGSDYEPPAVQAIQWATSPDPRDRAELLHYYFQFAWFDRLAPVEYLTPKQIHERYPHLSGKIPRRSLHYLSRRRR